MSNRFQPYKRNFNGGHSSDEEKVTIPRTLFNKLMKAANEILPNNPSKDLQYRTPHYGNAIGFFHEDLKIAEVKHLNMNEPSARKLVTFEGPLIFGRFRMLGQRITEQKFDDCIRDMSRLWQQPYGYIVVEIETRYKEKETDKPVSNLIVYKTRKGTNPVRVQKSEIDEYFHNHPVWTEGRKSKSYNYC